MHMQLIVWIVFYIITKHYQNTHGRWIYSIFFNGGLWLTLDVRQENLGDVLQRVSIKHNKKEFKHKAASSPTKSMVNTIQYNTSCWNFTQGIM